MAQTQAAQTHPTLATKSSPHNRSTAAKIWIAINLKIGALSLGSGGRILLYEECIVESEKLITQEEFHEAITVTQLVPGSQLLNFAAYVGYRITHGWASILALLLLGLPGSLLAVLIAGLVDLRNPTVRILLQGFCLGSLLLSTLFIWGFSKGLFRSHLAGVKATRLKSCIRGLVTVGVGVAVLFAVPLTYTLLLGGGVCLLVEFLL
jgi:chromate transport protein ChrA